MHMTIENRLYKLDNQAGIVCQGLTLGEDVVKNK